MSSPLRFLAVTSLFALTIFASACSDDSKPSSARNDNLGQGSNAACNAMKACGAGEFCDFAASATCAGAGVCHALPKVCTEECAVPGFCGCDGKLHCTQCQANSAGISISPDASLCGGTVDPTPGCDSNANCKADQLCDKSTATSCGAKGTCTARPEICTEECGSPKICGCDTKLYCTKCQMSSAGVSASPDQTICPPDGTEADACGGPEAIACGADSFCDLDGDKTCAGFGRCKPRTKICDASCAVPMLCGCDGKEYCSACVANGAGVAISPDGAACKK